MSRLEGIPCKPKCPDRSVKPNCHEYCKVYLKWIKEQEEKKKAIHQYKVDNNMHETVFLKNNTEKFTKNNLKKWR